MQAMHSFHNGAATNAAQCGLNDATGHEVVGKKVPMIPTVQQTTEELEDNNFMPSQLCLVHVYPLLKLLCSGSRISHCLMYLCVEVYETYAPQRPPKLLICFVGMVQS